MTPEEVSALLKRSKELLEEFSLDGHPMVCFPCLILDNVGKTRNLSLTPLISRHVSLLGKRMAVSKSYAIDHLSFSINRMFFQCPGLNV